MKKTVLAFSRITAPMIEGAWRSGVDMAEQVIATLAPAKARAAGQLAAE